LTSLPARLIAEAGLTERSRLLPDEEARALREQVWRIADENQLFEPGSPRTEIAFGTYDGDAVRALLRREGAGFAERVFVVWTFEAAAAELSYSDFVGHYDDLWYPSRDDVWVLARDESRFLTLNHEEFLIAGALDSEGRIR